jgi:chemotaxis protein MotA
MLLIVGSILVIVCVFGGYMAMGGHLEVLWQPFELVIIGGAAAGAFIISNPKSVIGKTGKAIGTLMKGPRHNKDSYLELLGLLYTIFKLAKSKGMLALEPHIENPEESELFKRFPKFYNDHHAMTFLTDYLRMMVLGSENSHEMETLMEEEIETHHHEHMHVANALQGVADAMPALGIVAAVLGIIKTMGAITEPPAVLGKLIGGALVGTFLGVFIAYGFIGPMASGLKAVVDAESKYYQCIKVALLAHMNGYAPSVSVEFARKALLSHVRPTFFEVEAAVQAVPAV